MEDDVDVWRYAIVSCMPETMTMWGWMGIGVISDPLQVPRTGLRVLIVYQLLCVYNLLCLNIQSVCVCASKSDGSMQDSTGCYAHSYIA